VAVLVCPFWFMKGCWTVPDDQGTESKPLKAESAQAVGGWQNSYLLLYQSLTIPGESYGPALGSYEVFGDIEDRSSTPSPGGHGYGVGSVYPPTTIN
jgi:hypothetical protein